MIGPAEMVELEEFIELERKQKARIHAQLAGNPYLWYYGSASDAEDMLGPYVDRDEAIIAGREDYEDFNFGICEAKKSLVRSIEDVETIAENIIEELIENNDACWGEDERYQNEHGPIRELAALVKTATETWLAIHPWFGYNFAHVLTREDITVETVYGPSTE